MQSKCGPAPVAKHPILISFFGRNFKEIGLAFIRGDIDKNQFYMKRSELAKKEAISLGKTVLKRPAAAMVSKRVMKRPCSEKAAEPEVSHDSKDDSDEDEAAEPESDAADSESEGQSVQSSLFEDCPPPIGMMERM